jgi:hypothetical protein
MGHGGVYGTWVVYGTWEHYGNGPYVDYRGRGERAAKKSEASVARDLGARGRRAPALSDSADVRTRTECAAWAWACVSRRLREAERLGTPAFESIGGPGAPCLIDGMHIADSKAAGHLRVRGAVVSATARERAWRRCRSAGGSTGPASSSCGGGGAPPPRRSSAVLELHRSPRTGRPPPGVESSGPSYNSIEVTATIPSARRGRLRFIDLDLTVDTRLGLAACARGPM